MTFSPEQLAIFAWFKSGSGNLIVKARAGTGKTTTIKAAFEHAPEPRILYAVFNARNQKEAEQKITDERVDVKTLHSVGFAVIKSVWSDVVTGLEHSRQVEEDRAVAAGAPFDRPETIAAITKLVGFAKNTYINPSVDDLRKISEEQDIECDVNIALRAIQASKIKDAAGRISFNDMVWLPVANNWVRPKYNLVCIDEAQDMNLPQLTMAKQSSNGRVVVVGDDRQAIYGFRGAVQNGMGMMKMTLRAQELGLTTTYRCPRSVVTLAAEIVPDYKCAPEAIDGEVLSVSEFVMLGKLKEGDAILSRLNAPLMPLALSLLRKNIPARIEGRDIGKQLVGMVRSMRARSVPNFIEKVEAWRTKQCERLMKAKNAEKKIEQCGDIASTLIALAEGSKSVADIESRITSLFQDTESNSKPAVVLSTVHKAKGLEWQRVFLLSETFRQSKGGEEANIYYVALTRAQKSLYLVAGKSAGNEPETKVGNSCSQTTEQAEKSELTISESGNDVAESNLGTCGDSTSGNHAEARAVTFVSNTASPDSELSSYALPQGLVYHKRGNVIAMAGVEYVCEMVSESRARFVNLKNRGEFESLSAAHEPSFVIRRMDEQELEDFLTRGVRRAKEQTNKNADEVMKTKKQKKEKKVKTRVGKANSERAESAIKGYIVQAKEGGKLGKMAYVTSLLIEGGLTKSQVVDKFLKKFPGTKEKTAKSTVAWTAGKLGNRSKHVEERSGESKPVTKKKTPAAPKKPSTPPKAKKLTPPKAPKTAPTPEPVATAPEAAPDPAPAPVEEVPAT